MFVKLYLIAPSRYMVIFSFGLFVYFINQIIKKFTTKHGQKRNGIGI